MHYFLDPGFDPSTGLLNEEESRHAMKSLRTQVGEEISVGDGKGALYHCTVGFVGKKQLKLDVIDTAQSPPPAHPVTIALAPTKNTSRYEWFLEKATELGVDHIIPLQSKRSERIHINTHRSERITLAAGKQSLRAHLPFLKELTSFTDLIKENADVKWIAHCETDFERVAMGAHIGTIKGKSVLILIGPEGDFTPEEITQAEDAGFVGIDLGENRLRTETAGVFAASLAAAYR